mmetsp:Transcript_13302/g.31937  ORF Transcript_13302/g.31937 Transcript_13302/m.31937 type:complete len:83 (-) Transcript_13302:2427-2675(-)
MMLHDALPLSTCVPCVVCSKMPSWWNCMQNDCFLVTQVYVTCCSNQIITIEKKALPNTILSSFAFAETYKMIDTCDPSIASW